MDCVILAGGIPTEEDPLFPFTGGRSKALLDVGGQPMLQYIVAALQAARSVDDVIVVGLEEADLAALTFTRPVHHLPDHGGLIANARAGIEWDVTHRPGAREILISTADIPLLTGEIVDRFVETCRPFDHLAYYNLVTREVMERRFPHSNRTFVKLKGIQVAGGDLTLVQTRVLDTDQKIWEALTNARKHAWQLARIVGFWTLFKLLARQLAIREIEEAAYRLLGGRVKVMVSPFPELAMDVDKPPQVDLLRTYFRDGKGMD